MVLAVVLLLGTFRAGLFVGKNSPRPVEIKIDTLMIIDTVVIEKPVLAHQTFVRHDTLVVVDEGEVKDAEWERDSALWRCAQLEWKNDSLVAILARTQAHYHKDSLYDIWVSGVAPALDSCRILKATEYVIVQKESISKASHWRLQATFGPSIIYGFNGDFHAGAGLSFGLGYSF